MENYKLKFYRLIISDGGIKLFNIDTLVWWTRERGGGIYYLILISLKACTLAYKSSRFESWESSLIGTIIYPVKEIATSIS